MTKTAVIYARYSSDSQSEQSIEGQLRVCEEYAKTHEILILDTYIDRAMTGTNDNRPDFQRMIKDSNAKKWDYVLCYKLDRFSRNKYEMAMHKKTLKDNGIRVYRQRNIFQTVQRESSSKVCWRAMQNSIRQSYPKRYGEEITRVAVKVILQAGACLSGISARAKKRL